MKTEVKTTNSLKYNVTKTIGGKTYVINIRLNDECKNGHNDFSITGTVYEAGKPMTDRNMISGGAIGDEIAKKMPSLKIFNNLHLCDVNGARMYAIANGFYHLSNGFNDAKPNTLKFKAEYCEYYRITAEQFETLRTSEDEQVFTYYLVKLGIVGQWKDEALKAIKLLEELTGEKFKDDSTKLQVIRLDAVKEAEIIARLESGYYSPERIQEREDIKRAEAKQKELQDIEDDFNKTCEKAKNEYLVLKAVLLAGLSIKNFIYYTHSNEGRFNWNTSSYNKEVSAVEFDGFLDWVKLEKPELPKGIIFKLK